MGRDAKIISKSNIWRFNLLECPFEDISIWNIVTLISTNDDVDDEMRKHDISIIRNAK